MDKNFALIFFTLFWVVFAIIGSCIGGLFRERAVIRCCVIMTAICCWLVWIVTFLMQMNPLQGPRADQKIIFGMMCYWKNSYIDDSVL
ncbi:V-type proton ATPase subunit e [Scaptodrosophila lebanonensis]|uniref:V-type proton ATPase subunit e n=1 Tax=Drosophila lebanonensis TaxID=7225 RepID=A0A6J2TKG9_DROLE|nr:V-type proton ATPase subunit e [Scaptodrosophila lebanonensis]